jgi:hypothetical protein
MDMPPKRYRVILATIVAVGFGAALLIFAFAELGPADPLGESKMYVHDMVLYGGKTNMVLGEFATWIGSLWHGTRLAFTVAALTALVAGAFWYFFSPVPQDTED